MKPEALSRQISMVYQNPEDMFIKDSIGGDIAYAMEVRRVPDSAKRTDELLERFRLKELKTGTGAFFPAARCAGQALPLVLR